MPQFVHSDLGNRGKGDVLEVTLDKKANVRLLDDANFTKYKSGTPYRFVGGRATKSPVRIVIPSDGRWHAVVDLRGSGGSVRAGFRVSNGSASLA